MIARYRLGLAFWGGASLVWIYTFAALLPKVEFAFPLTLIAIFLADLGSYIFHYLIDHYGRPVPGGLVHEFQRHHLIPYGIAEKSVAEVLYPAARIAAPLLLLLYWPLISGLIPPAVGLFVFVLFSCWVLAQLFHRWTHKRPPAIVRLAQKLHLLVSPREHDVHHRQPFDSRFAVITGWSNFPLDFLHAPAMLDALMRLLGKEKRGLVRSLEEISASGAR